MAILKKKENDTAGAATGGAAQTGGQSAAASPTGQPTGQTAPAATTLSGGAGSFAESGGAVSGGEGGGGREQTKAGYTGGQRYFQANQEGAKKLANQITNPLNEQAKTIQEEAQKKALEGIAGAGESTFNQDYLDRAGEDARQLDDSQRQSVKDTLGGVYSGPQDYFNEEARQQNRQLGQDIDQLGTVAGTSQALSDAAGLNDRKYSAGMRNFDAALLRQDPTLRENVKGMGSLAGDNTTAMDEQRQSVLDAIGSGRDLAAERKFAAEQQFQDIQKGQTDQWGNDLEQLRGDAQGVNDALNREGAMSQRQLDLLGMTAADYDKLRNEYIATGYTGANNDGKDYAPTAYKANNWRNLQLDEFGLDQSQLDNIDYRNVVGGEDFARYDALNQLRGVQNQEGLGSNFGETPEQLKYNLEAMNSKRDAFLASGIEAPQTAAEFKAGSVGSGTKDGWLGDWSIPATYGKDTSLRRDPMTGQLVDRSEYMGPTSYKAGTKFELPTNAEQYDPNNTIWDTSIDQGQLDRRNEQSGFTGDAGQFADALAPIDYTNPYSFGNFKSRNPSAGLGSGSWQRNNEYGDDVAFGDQPWKKG